MIPYKIVVSSEDLATMFDTTAKYASMMLSKIRKEKNKHPRSKLTVYEVAEHFKIEAEELIKALNREI